MNDVEIARLRELLALEVARWERQHPDIVHEGSIWLDEDSGAHRYTEAEILVFQLDRAYLHKLLVAWWAYETLIDLTSEFSDEVTQLIIKARADCPPAVYYGHSVPFTLRCDEQKWFSWFAKTFLDIPERQSYAFHAKRNFNTMNLVSFGDEHCEER